MSLRDPLVSVSQLSTQTFYVGARAQTQVLTFYTALALFLFLFYLSLKNLRALDSWNWGYRQLCHADPGPCTLVLGKNKCS